MFAYLFFTRRTCISCYQICHNKELYILILMFAYLICYLLIFCFPSCLHFDSNLRPRWESAPPDAPLSQLWWFLMAVSLLWRFGLMRTWKTWSLKHTTQGKTAAFVGWKLCASNWHYWRVFCHMEILPSAFYFGRFLGSLKNHLSLRSFSRCSNVQPNTAYKSSSHLNL